MGEWDDIGSAAISASGPKFNPGHSYLFEVAGVKFANLHHGQTFIVETVVHESDDPLLPPGTRPSWTANMKHKPTKGNILCFTGALLGVDPSNEPLLRRSVNGQHIEQILSAAQPAKGMFARATASQIETKSENDFTVVKFSPYVGAKLPSKLNDAPVAPGVAAVSPNAAPQVQMPGGFGAPAPGGFGAPGGFPVTAPQPAAAFVMPGMPAPMGLSTLPPVGGPPPMSTPGFGQPASQPSFGQQPQAFGQQPQAFGQPASQPSFGQQPGFGQQAPQPFGQQPQGFGQQAPAAPMMPGFGQQPPMMPAPAPAAPAQLPWPPAGWAPLPPPNPAGYHYKVGTQEYRADAELRALQVAGQI